MSRLSVVTYGIGLELVGGKMTMKRASNGCPVIYIPDGGVRIGQHDADGSILNVRGNSEEDWHLVNAVTRGAVVNRGDVLLLSRKKPAGSPNEWTSDHPYPGALSRSANADIAAVAFVGYPPVSGQIFPPAVGSPDNPYILMGRLNPILESNIDLSVLPTDLDYSALIPNAGEPFDPDYVAAGLNKFCGEAWSGWSTDTKTPGRQNFYYGREWIAHMSKALLLLCSNLSDSEKMKVAKPVVDWGVTLAGAFFDGRINQANGGHNMGRLPCILAAGKMLGWGELTDPTWIPQGNVFNEKLAHFSGTAWWHDVTWTRRWRYNSEVGGTIFDPPLETAPSNWHQSTKWQIEGYYGVGCGAGVGSAIAMRLMGLESIVEDWVKGVLDQFMVGPSGAAQTELLNAGVSIPWGEEWPKPWNGDGIQKQAYDQLVGVAW